MNQEKAEWLLRNMMSAAKELIASERSLVPIATLFKDGDTSRLIGLPPEAMNNAFLKDKVFQFVKQEARRTHAEAVAIITDAFSLQQTKEEQQRFLKNPEEFNKFREFCSRYGMKAAAAKGYGKLVEIILITFDSPDLIMLHTQKYERTEQGIEFLEQKLMTGPEAHAEGRLFSFFEHSIH